MKLRSILLSAPLAILGCASSTPTAEVAPAPSAAPEATSAPVTEVDLNAVPPPATEASEKKAEKKVPADARKAAEEFGMIGLLNAAPDPAAPTEVPLLTDQPGMPANLWGTEIGESYGVGGLGLAGTGAGAGGTGQGTIGLGSLGTLGRGAGGGTGQGFGSGSGGFTARTHAPKLTIGASSVSGRLPPEVIQRIVRQNFNRFRYCYEKGLAINPTLAGKINVRFVIGKDGSTTSATDAGSDLPSKDVVTCVLTSFKALSYPAPDGGVVSVVYPLKFEPGDPAKKSPPPPPAPPAPKTP